MNVMKTLGTTAVAIGLLSTAPIASAQFVGDYFFREPSQAAAPGDTVTFEVLAFLGAEPLGATRYNVSFPAGTLRVVDAIPGGSEELAAGFVTDASDSAVDVIALNSVSDAQPIGTVSLGFISFEVLAGAGSIVNLSINPAEALRTDTTAVTSLFGFGGEIVVGSNAPIGPQGPEPSPEAALAAADPQRLRARADRLRRPGSQVPLQLLVPRSSGAGWQTVSVELAGARRSGD